MSDSEPSASITALTPRQRRLRVLTIVILGFIFVMILVGLNHPFFHLARPANVTPTVRKALAVKGLMILGYWTVCFLLAGLLPLLAWLDVREVRRKMLVARRDMWKEIADNSRERMRERESSRSDHPEAPSVDSQNGSRKQSDDR